MTNGESPAGGPSEDALWDFAVALYARDGVAAACLTLQDQAAVDVNVLMLAIFAQQRGTPLRDGDVAGVDALVRDWRADVVRPLRRLRTRLRDGPPPAPSAASERLRNRIKAAELDAERMQLQAMQRWLERAMLPSTPADDAPRVVARYFAGREALAPEVEAALATLMQAMHG